MQIKLNVDAAKRNTKSLTPLPQAHLKPPLDGAPFPTHQDTRGETSQLLQPKPFFGISVTKLCEEDILPSNSNNKTQS